MLSFNFEPFPELETERLLLRRIKKTDVSALFAMRSNPLVMQYIAKPLAQTEDDAMKFVNVIEDSLNSNLGITWAITIKGEPDLIGTIGFWRNDLANHRAEIGYMLSNHHWQKGFMYEAIVKVLDYGFRELGFHSMMGITAPENLASQATMKKAGFKQEAYFREDFHFDGQFLDSVVFGILEKDFLG